MEQFDTDIRNFAFGGAAYGVHPSGKGCFVRGAAPGENVTVEVISEHARFIRAKLIQINRAAPERIVPRCPYADTCPGCSFGHITYEAELFWKQNSFEHFLLGTGCVEKSVIRHPVPSPERYNWRNKIRLAVENGICGYRGEDNRTLIPVISCQLVNAEINRFLAEMDIPESGSIELRYTPANGVVRLDESNCQELIFDTLPGYGDFPVPAGAFFQTNPQVASLLADAVVENIAESGIKELIELHCGAGVFSLCAAEKISGLHTGGAEINASSIETARKAAKMRGLSGRCKFSAGDAAKFYRKQQNCRLLLVDPPRSGLDGNLMKNIIKNPPEVMIYVSCGPDTLQRDIKKLAAAGMGVISAQLFDMFPCTSHFESLTILRREK